ncbi:histone-lysine N-methyltransferase, H3 lysine-9 specific SUVH5 isoform X2 [Triticum aestivum]|uniref:histone-lysine N-methyltransferase, H3 lysine-9 specific SUVH5 isoform X2 n=1 Tax=Triticum aestivum TaxID=4565 RepID=UPI001D009D76|nr:histone-lysine N-methyltransferase, H3 lysine-9 specific SUVH5-like isoform X2 [Triticum aestivum]
METGKAAVPPRATSGRRYKALTPWRFQRGFVRYQAKTPAAAAAAPRGRAGAPAGGSGTKRPRSSSVVGSGGRSAGDPMDGQSKKRSTRSATMKNPGAEMDCLLRRATRSATAKSSDGVKMENGACSGAGKDFPLKRHTRSTAANSSHAIKMENDSSSSAGKDFQIKRGTHRVTTRSSNGEKMDNNARTGAEMDCGLGKSSCNIMGDGLANAAGGDCRVTTRSTNGEKMDNNARTGAEMDCGLGKSSCNIMGDGLANAAGGDCCFEGPDYSGVLRDEHVQNFGTGGSVDAGDGAACIPEGIQSNVGAENCESEGSEKSRVTGNVLKSNVSSAADHVLEQPEGKGANTGNGASKESDVAAKGCSSAVPGSNANGPNCRRGRKEIVPWRFQIGYKRSFSKAFCSNGGSLETPEYRAQGSSTQCTPGTRSTVRCYASPLSNVRVSAVRDFSSGKGEKETRTAYKKVKTEKDDDNQGMPKNGVALAREKAIRSLRDFRLIYKNLLNKLEDRSREGGADLQAYKIFRDRFLAQCNDERFVGNVPGINVGDIFYARVELCIIGLHRPHRLGIDHIRKEDGTCIAVSIVAYALLSDVKDNFDALVYSGSRTATMNQKIEGTNLALKKSMDTKTPVRVIHGFTIHAKNSQRKSILVYGGLYLVEKYWREKESEDRYVYMFRMRRMAGQKHIDIDAIMKSEQAEPYDGVIMKDISQGLERIPVSVLNSISDEHPMPYIYMSRLKYPPNYQPAPPAGCACVGGCSDSKLCACVVKNGGEIPFNDKGCIIAAKPLVYECGPSCKCPPTCHNRVGQKGIKFRLQVFKTKSMGWGVKTLDYIPSGSFVCEYIGEVLDDEEAQKRMTDEYLFAIGHNYYDESLWEGLSRSIPSLQNGPGKDEEAGFAVDASKMGNFAKFINHSCTPNLYAQNVLYDHDDKSAPHIMFFACEDIPPGQELVYHYNYAIDQVHDENGNIKKKKCLCGSVECDGWLY